VLTSDMGSDIIIVHIICNSILVVVVVIKLSRIVV